MKIEIIENGDLDFDSENYNELKEGIVIFPDTLEDLEKIKRLKRFLETL